MFREPSHAVWGSLAKERLEDGQHFPTALQMGALAGGTFESGVFKIILQIPLMSCPLTLALERLGLWRWVDGRPTWHIPSPLQIYPQKEAAAICI